jgi:hypothetical protein
LFTFRLSSFGAIVAKCYFDDEYDDNAWFDILVLDPYMAAVLSGVISVIISVVFYRVTLGSAEHFLNRIEL